jgi:hypothetical protein
MHRNMTSSTRPARQRTSERCRRRALGSATGARRQRNPQHPTEEGEGAAPTGQLEQATT